MKDYTCRITLFAPDGYHKRGGALPVEESDCILKDQSETDPEQIRDIGPGDYSHVRIDDDKSPNEGSEYKRNIDRRQEIVFENKLNRGKGQIKDNVKAKRKDNLAWQTLLPGKIKNIPKRKGNNGIEYRPDWTK